MKTELFNAIIENQINLCKDILIDKAREYATDDRLHNFKVAAELQGCSPKEALIGMMAKHTVSIYDLTCLSREVSMGMWSEKITDNINYLLLLRAVIQEEMDAKMEKCTKGTEEDWKNMNPKTIREDEIKAPFGLGRRL